MEIKEYLAIFKKQAAVLAIVMAVAVAGSFLFEYARPVSYTTSLTLNITRTGTQITDQYKYDDFYRLQADEKFAETVVQWLQSPRFVSDIFNRAGIDAGALSLRQLSGMVKAEKLSSQVISVQFQGNDPQISQKIADSIASVTEENTKKLNAEQNESSWFTIVAQSPVTRKNGVEPFILFIISAVAGFLVGIWAILIAYYLKK